MILTIGTRILVAAVIGAFGAFSAFSQAQVSTADLVGTVTDPNGAVVAGAAVTARNGATGSREHLPPTTTALFNFLAFRPENMR